ncbi:MAG: replication protein [Nitrospirae bacterium]|nr:replication protein [Nitrospirota bacterium]
MDKLHYHKEPIERNNGNGQKTKKTKGIPVGLIVDDDDYESLISPFKMKDEGKFTMVDNDVFEKLPICKVRFETHRVYEYLYRKIIGYQRVIDRISLSQIEEGTGLATRSVSRALAELLKNNMIFKKKKRDNSYYGLTRFDKWKSGVTLTIVPKKPIQDDLFDKYYTKSALVTHDHKMVTSAEHKRKEEIYIKKSLNARAREGQRPCEMTTTNELTDKEILLYAVKHNCNENHPSCPDDCIIWPKLNLIEFFTTSDITKEEKDKGGNKTQINGNGQDSGQGNGNGLTAQPKKNDIARLNATLDQILAELD